MSHPDSASVGSPARESEPAISHDAPAGRSPESVEQGEAEAEAPPKVRGISPTDHDYANCFGKRLRIPNSPLKSAKQIIALQAVYGILAGFKPAEPYVVPYMLSECAITEDELYTYVFPAGSYSFLVFLVILMILSAFISYKWLLYIGWCGYMVCYYTLVWGKGVVTMVINQTAYGLVMASETIYYSSFYFFVDPAIFNKVSAISRISMLAAHLVADGMGQLLVSFCKGFNMQVLFIITAVSATLTLVPLILIPRESSSVLTDIAWYRKFTSAWKSGYMGSTAFVAAIFGSACQYLYVAYASNVLYDIYVDDASKADSLYGVFTLCGRITGVIGGLCASKVKKVPTVLLPVLSVVLAGVSMLLTWASNVVWACVFFAIQYVVNEFLLTLAWGALAATCPEESYPTVFLTAMLISSAIQSVVQATVFSAFWQEIFGYSVSRSHMLWIGFVELLGAAVLLALFGADSCRNAKKRRQRAGEAPVASQRNAEPDAVELSGVSESLNAAESDVSEAAEVRGVHVKGTAGVMRKDCIGHRPHEARELRDRHRRQCPTGAGSDDQRDLGESLESSLQSASYAEA